jgi:hypothetical protein
MLKRIVTPTLMFMLLLLTACGEKGETAVKEDLSTPEYTATKFFYTLYENKDIKATAKYVTPKLARIIKSYGSTKAVTRHLLNMQFDEVIIEIDRGRNLRETYGEKASISLIFRGQFQGNKIADTRTINLVKREGQWLISKIKDDPYAR